MDNKRWYKRISTCFWFLLATLMFWLPIVITIFSFFLHIENSTDFQELGLIGWYNFGDNVLGEVIGSLFTGDRFENMPLPFIYEMFSNLFDLLGFDLSFAYNYWSIVALSWFATVYFFELLVDFVVWLPKMCHAWLERWCV